MKKLIKFIPMLLLLLAFALYSPTVSAQRGGAGKQKTMQTQPKNQCKKPPLKTEALIFRLAPKGH